MAPEAKEDDSTLSNQSNSLTSHTLRGFVWLFSGSGIQAILRIVVLAVLARLLTQEDFGLVGAALIIAGFVGLFSQLGLAQALVQRSELSETHVRTAFTVFTFFGVGIGGILAACAPLIAQFLRMDGLIPVIQVVALSFPIQGLITVPTALLQRKMRFRWIATINVISYLVGYGMVGIGLAAAGFGIWALVGANLGALVTATVCLQAVQPYPKRPQLDREAFRELIRLGGGYSLANVFNQIGTQADNLIVGRWLGPAALGIYGRAYQLLVFPVTLFGTVLSQVLFPSMSKVQHDPERFTQAFRRGTAVTALIYLPVSIVLLILAPEIIMVLLGPKWTEVVVPFQILAMGMLFRASKVNHVVAQAKGAVYRRAWRQLIFMMFVVVGAVIGQEWGVEGVAVAVLIALTANFLLMAQLSLSLTALTWQGYLALFKSPSILTVCALVLTWSMATALRSLSAPAVVILFGTATVTGTGLLLLIYWMPRQVVGEEGLWMVDTILMHLPQRLSSQLGWMKNWREGRAAA